MANPLLEGHVVQVSDERDKELRRLRDEVESLKDQLDIANRQIESAKREATRRVAVVRDILSPIHNGLRVLFGELDQIPADSVSQATPSNGRPTSASANKMGAAYQKWIDRFGADSLKGRCIHSLLEHDTMTVRQLMVAMSCSKQSVYNTVAELMKVSLIRRNGDMYALVE